MDPSKRQVLAEEEEMKGGKDTTLEFDQVLKEHVGEFGTYQRCVCIFLSLVGITNAFYIMDIVFLAATPQDFWCVSPNRSSPAVSANSGINNRSGNPLQGSLVAKCSPEVPVDGFYRDGFKENGTLSFGSGNVSITDPHGTTCEKWSFGSSEFEDSIIKEWQLVCGQSWLVAASNSAFLAGTLIGVLSGGFLSDRFGRRPVLAGFAALAVAFRVIMAFSPSIHFFAAIRFLVGFTNLDTYTSAFVLGTELVGPSWRVFFSTLMGLSWAVGYMLVAAMAYLLRHQTWRCMTLTLTGCCCYVLLYFKLVPESPRWQLTRGKKMAAMDTLRRMAKVNRRDLPDDVSIVVQAEQKHMRPLTLLRSRTVRWRSSIILYTWLSVALVYYGLSLNVGDLAGNLYLNTFIMGAVEIPAYFLVQWLQNSRLGRRGSLALLLGLSGGSLLAVYFIHQKWTLAGTVLAMLGKLAVTGAYSAAYVITAELYPTSIRQVALSVAATVGRVGGVFAPFVGYLAQYNPVIPTIIYSLLTITAGALSLFLPETRGRSLPVKIEDMDKASGSGFLCGSNDDSDIDSTECSSVNDDALETKIPLADSPCQV